MHSLNITCCIKLNDRPDGIIHQIEVWWVWWPHVWHHGLSFSNVWMRPEFMTSMSCDSVYCMCDAAWSSRWLMTQLTNDKRACVVVFVPSEEWENKARFPFKRNRLRCVRCVTARNASACVGKQPIMVATASNEHSYWLALAFVAWKFAVFVYATHATQAIAFEWKPGLSDANWCLNVCCLTKDVQ